MAGKTAITAEYVRARLDYDPETGIFTWKPKPGNDHQSNAWNAKYAGRVAGSLQVNGYLEIGFQTDQVRVRTYAHRLAWLYVHGEWPTDQIDHIDGDRANNRLSNLRPATNAQNVRNSRRRSTNKSGIKGVSWDKSRRRWVASIWCDMKQKILGSFRTKEDAAAAYAEAAHRLHGEFARIE